ncbi:hypothetical protein M407DRAFT_174910 [Tulasnella calospora MUT 4182]|uniref:Uncharacterized protein n=1 Tax=Tulasnella calospora MUT 4182 TaxID=1051891 RepID=A0A0C3K741_9AGAM|nr:hypothetical protein M407DRAFT_174910 [Tulasnella calospora MUT 4182]
MARSEKRLGPFHVLRSQRCRHRRAREVTTEARVVVAAFADRTPMQCTGPRAALPPTCPLSCPRHFSSFFSMLLFFPFPVLRSRNEVSCGCLTPFQLRQSWRKLRRL